MDLLQDYLFVRNGKRRDILDGAHTSVDVGRVRLLARLGALLLVARRGGLLASILLLRRLGRGGRGLGGGLLVCGLRGHFGGLENLERMNLKVGSW